MTSTSKQIAHDYQSNSCESDVWYSLDEIKEAISKVGKKVGINSEKGLCWQCPLIDELTKETKR